MKMFSSIFSLLLAFVLIMFLVIPSIACDSCGRDGPASYSQLIQIDTKNLPDFNLYVLAAIGGGTKVLPADSAEWPDAMSVSKIDKSAYIIVDAVIFAGYDTGDPTEALTENVDETDMIGSFRSGDRKSLLHIDPGRSISVQTA